MKHTVTKNIRNFITSGFALLIFSTFTFATPIIRRAAGVNAAAIQSAVDQFRNDLGGALNPNNGQSFTSGRREINWDGVPDNLSAPNNFPKDFFNVNSPRGVVFNSIESGSAANFFMVSADASNPTNTLPRFGNINPTYPNTFQTFSAERLFIAQIAHQMEVNFFIPGTKIPATVSGFGIVFADVDQATHAIVQLYGADGTLLEAQSAFVQNNGLSFVGISFDDGTRVARVVIESGNTNLSQTNTDQSSMTGVDVVAMDDFIYGEPRALQFHSGDADGDGSVDARVFRPESGTWFTLNSGSNTVSITNWGLRGDIPVDGDFDGDSRADLAIFRPSDGAWFINRSSNGTVISQSFGSVGDKPVAGDYDKDGITDIAVWRPSNGNFFVLRSKDNFGSFFSFAWGMNGDIPVQGGAQ